MGTLFGKKRQKQMEEKWLEWLNNPAPEDDVAATLAAQRELSNATINGKTAKTKDGRTVSAVEVKKARALLRANRVKQGKVASIDAGLAQVDWSHKSFGIANDIVKDEDEPSTSETTVGGTAAAGRPAGVTVGTGNPNPTVVPKAIPFKIPTTAKGLKKAAKGAKALPKNPYKVGTAEYRNWEGKQATAERTELAKVDAAIAAAIGSQREPRASGKRIAGPQAAPATPMSPVSDALKGFGDWMTQGRTPSDTHKNRIKPGTPQASRATPKLTDRKKKSGIKIKGKNQYYGGR